MSYDKNTVIMSHVDAIVRALEATSTYYELKILATVHCRGNNNLGSIRIRRLTFGGHVVLERMIRYEDCDEDDVVESREFEVRNDPGSEWKIEIDATELSDDADVWAPFRALVPAEAASYAELVSGLVPKPGEHTSLPLRPRHGCALPGNWRWTDHGSVIAVEGSYASAYSSSVQWLLHDDELRLVIDGSAPRDVVAAILAAAPTKIPKKVPSP